MLVLVAVFVLIIIYLIITAIKIRKEIPPEILQEREENTSAKRVTFIPLGFIITVPLGIALGNIPLGIALGPAFGLLIGIFFTGKKKKTVNTRDLTPEELAFKKTAQTLIFQLLLLGILLYFITYVLVR